MINLLNENNIKYLKCDKNDFCDSYSQVFIENNLDYIVCAVKERKIISCLLVSKKLSSACIFLHSLSSDYEVDMRFLLVSIYDLVKCGVDKIYYRSDSYLGEMIDIIEREQPFFQIDDVHFDKKVLIRNT